MPLSTCDDLRVPLRVGTDLVLATTVRDAIAAHGDRYLRRVYTPGELADCTAPDGAPDPLRLAARFAAKEAAMKALRVGGDHAVPWTAIEVRRADGGHAEMTLHGAASELAAAAGISDLAVSLSHEEPYATAVVVAEIARHLHQDRVVDRR